MNDLGKMGTEGTKLFWKLFTNSIHCKGMSEKTIQNHIINFKLFLYWARLINRKLLIRRMFFDLPIHSPFRFLELVIMRSSAPYTRYTSPNEAWMDIFRFSLCSIKLAMGHESNIEAYNKLLEIESDWRMFFEKAKIDLL